MKKFRTFIKESVMPTVVKIGADKYNSSHGKNPGTEEGKWAFIVEPKIAAKLDKQEDIDGVSDGVVTVKGMIAYDAASKIIAKAIETAAPNVGHVFIDVAP